MKGGSLMEGSKVIVIPKTVLPNVDATTGIIKKRRVAAYCRVSSDMDDQLHSLETQKTEFDRKIKENPGWEYVGLYFDEGITGTSLKKRDGFNKMIEDALNGKIDLILVKSISRFARNTVDCIKTKRDLEAKGVEVFFEKENISSLDGASETMLTVYASFAQEESRQISTNVTWGIRARMRDGKYRIAATTLGYKKDENGNMVIDEEGKETVKLIFSLFLNGFTYREIIDELIKQGRKNSKGEVKWLISNITSILGNEKYCGDVIYQKTYCKSYLTHERVINNGELEQFFVPNHHESIIDKSIFMYVQLLRKKRKENYKPIENKNNYPLAGLVYCANCGRPMRRVQYYKGKPYERIALTCKMQKKNNQNYLNCNINNTIDYNTLLKLAEKIVREESNEIDTNLLINSVSSAMTITESSKKINELSNMIIDHKNKISELVNNQIAKGLSIEEYGQTYALYQGKIKECELEIERLSSEQFKISKKTEFNQELLGFLSKNTTISIQIVSKVIRRIYRMNDNSVLIILAKESVDQTTLERIRNNIEDFRKLELKQFVERNNVLDYRILRMEEIRND